MKNTFIVILFMGLGLSLIAQSTEEIAEKKAEAYKIAGKAIKIMDKGDYDESIKMLRKSEKLDPENYIFPYEIGYAYYLKKDAKNAIKTLKKVLKFENINDECYTLLGNIYDYEKKPQKAIDIYEEGLEKFPESGRLYYERGIVLEGMEEYDAALASWENGIRALPEYASNYHTASIYFNKYTTEKIWGIMYGELFINLERGSKKTEEVSKLLFDTYKSSITINSETEAGVSFSKNTQMTLPASGEKMVPPFSMTYELTMALSAISEMSQKELVIESFSKIRTAFIENWYDQKRNIDYPNVLFDWHKELIDLGYFESYNYWLLSQGNLEEFDAYYTENQASFDKFIEWFGENPMRIDKEHRFYRQQY